MGIVSIVARLVGGALVIMAGVGVAGDKAQGLGGEPMLGFGMAVVGIFIMIWGVVGLVKMGQDK